MKSAQVGSGVYEARIRRAEYLASQHPFAAEVLRFYSRIAEFQKTLFSDAQNMPQQALQSPAAVNGYETASAPAVLREHFPRFDLDLALPGLATFLLLIGQVGPAPLATASNVISHLDAASHRHLLAAYWEVGGVNDQFIGPFAQFVARAFAQPFAEFLAQQITPPPVLSTQHNCPLCGGQPLLGVLRLEGDGGKRRMLCAFCSQEWDFRRIYCYACGEEDEKKLPVYVAEQFPHIRVEACDTCKICIRTIDLTKNGNAIPIVDDLAAIPLTLWAQEHGYIRLQPNLLGA
jgi:FdhE protein